MKSISAWLFVTLLMMGFSFGQTNEDFFVTAMGDTVFGQITRHRERIVKIKPADGGATRAFKPEEARQFYLAKKNSRFAPIDRPNDMNTKEVFQRCLSYGRIILYNLSYPNNSGMMGMPGAGVSVSVSLGKGDFIVAQKGKYGRLLELNNQTLFKSSKETRKGRLLELIGDDKELADALKAEEGFNTEMIVEYIEAYNKKHK